MIVLHEAAADSVESILSDGIKQSDTGAKTDELHRKTDEVLDASIPDHLEAAGVTRKGSIYAYVVLDGDVISITDGERIEVGSFIERSNQSVLEIEVDPRQCFVSDPDAYDKLENSIKNQQDEKRMRELAEDYWSRVRSLNMFNQGDIDRPEVMIPYSISPDDIRLVSM